MTPGTRILKRLLKEANVEEFTIEIGTEKSRAFAKVRHPVTGTVAIFNASNTRNRDAHAIANELSRMRRFRLHGIEHKLGRPY